MFKSIRWKITVIFVLLVLATELFIGGFNILGVMKHYHDDFSNSINEVFTEDIKNDLLAAANEISIPAESTDTSIVIEENSQSNINLINNILYLPTQATSELRRQDIPILLTVHRARFYFHQTALQPPTQLHHL